MVRVTTSNYGADATTQFAWATSGSDQFSREDDLYNLAQAVEHHTHAATRGLAVARLSTGAVDSAAIAGLAVGTPALAALSVTNAKLAAGAVTMDKITFPLIQATDNFAGGFRLRESTNTYQVGYYIAANGLAVFGAGPIAGISIANLILGQSGQVSVGTVQGAAKFNVLQSTDGIGTGFRLYGSNPVNYFDIWHDSAAVVNLRNTGGVNSLYINPTGYMCLGSANVASAKFTLLQAAQGAAEGLQFIWGGGTGNIYMIDTAAMVVKSAGTAVQLEHSAATFSPLTTLGASLGSNAFRWLKLWVQDLDVSGTVTGVNSFPVNGVIFFPTLANLTSAGASWARYTAADGRLLIGAGTTFSQTFAEATNYGSNWTPSSGLSNSTVPVLADGQTFLASPTGATTNVATATHTHPAPTLNGTSTAWLPPMRAGIWGQRIS